MKCQDKKIELMGEKRDLFELTLINTIGSQMKQEKELLDEFKILGVALDEVNNTLTSLPSVIAPLTELFHATTYPIIQAVGSMFNVIQKRMKYQTIATRKNTNAVIHATNVKKRSFFYRLGRRLRLWQ